MLCPNCETENVDGARFCDVCGFPLGSAGARTSSGTSTTRRAGSPVGTRLSASAVPAGMDTQVDAPSGDAINHDVPRETLGPEPAEAPEFDSVEAVYPEFPDDDFFASSDIGFSFPEPELPETTMLREPVQQASPPQAEPTRVLPQAEETVAPSEPHERVSARDYAYTGIATQEAAAEEPVRAPLEGDKAAVDDFTKEMPPIGGNRDSSRDFRMVNGVPSAGKGKRIAFIVAGVIVGVVIAALATFALGLWGGKAVPDVTGMTEGDATSALAEEGFTVRTAQVRSDDDEGIVLITDPQAGSRADEGSEIVIHVAAARFVPDIVGKPKGEAEAMLGEAGYGNVRFEAVKSDEDEDIILSVSPDVGTRAKSSAELVVKVSEAYRVPSVSGLDASAASDTITDAGLTPEIVYIDTDQFEDGTIIGTDPEAGTKVTEGAYVTISVARARGVELESLTQSYLGQGSTVTVGGVDYEIESLISVSYQGDDTVAFTATGRPKITFFGETLYASSSQTIAGQVVWSEDNEIISIS